MTSGNPEVWLIYPRENRSFRDYVKSHCQDVGWSFQSRPTTRIVLPKGRPIRVLTPEDATNIYRRVHTRQVGVWQIGDAAAPTRSKPKKTTKHYLPLSRFVRYKAFHCQLDPNRSGEPLSETVADFQSWIENADCEGESDPRCLPFHVFETDIDQYDLSKSDDRKRFENDHGRQHARRDARDRIWYRPNARQMHGREILQIAGHALMQGFHWDVSSEHKVKISNISEVWEIKRNGYLNVYPNGHIRGSSKARKLH